MFREILPEYMADQEVMLDEGMAVLYNTISGMREQDTLEENEQYDILAGEEVFSDESGLLLRRMEDYYELFDPESRYSYLLYPSPGGYLPYKLARIQNPQGHRIQFFYDGNGWLCGIKDSAGRDLDVTTSHEGRITKVALQDDNGMKSHVLVRYAYNKEQDLETVTDAIGADTCLKYRNHLLVQKTDRNRNSFYREYDRYEDGARAVRTWGDGDVFSLWFDYHDENNYNTVRTSPEGLPTEYHYNDKKICTWIVYPDLTETRENYNDRWQLESQVDEEGRITQYQYNDWSQITGVTFADASKIRLSYDEKGRLLDMTDQEGNASKWIYNDDDTINRTVDETGAETVYQYNRYRLVNKVIYPNKGEVCLEYDKHFNLSRVTLPDGSSSSWEYDQRGNCLAEKNPLGAVTAYQYDALDRMVRAKLPDGNDIRLSYDGYQDVLHAEDNRTKVDFTYTILGSIASRTQGDHRTAYAYNSQEELVSVTNEKGETYRFERDAKGNIVREEGFDGQVCTYERDYSGLVTRINRPGGRFTSYRYDRLGRVTRTDYHDGTYETFVYNKNGALTEAENQDARIRLERDRAGRITREWQDNHWVSSKYDETGNRIQTASSFGADIRASRNKTGQVTRLAACMDKELPWAAGMEYNAMGQETKRMYPGGVCSSMEYDRAGRPVFHEVTGTRGTGRAKGLSGSRVSGSSEESLRRRRYKWDINCQLKEVANELAKGTTVFSYDQFGNLASARESGFETIFRTADTVGNLYETGDYSDRIYGTGSRLELSRIDLKEKRNRYQGGHGKLVTRGVEFLYDEEGNLVKKTEPDGRTWTYTYSGNGMLAEVTRPDRSCVRFKYDALGRRTEKSVIGGYSGNASGKQKEKVVKFLWDGNTPLHEWEEERTTDSIPAPQPVADYKADFLVKLEKRAEEKARKEAEKGQDPPENLVTWVFGDGFVPRAKITKDGCYSIISDYLGTPVEAYDGNGNKVWERELDIYGRVKTGRNETGERNFIPFRFQGQYEDGETGLYYNRFRYYSPEEGCYTQQDPIGLAGGNPTLYGYVFNTLWELDPFGLWSDIKPDGLGHHPFPVSIAEKLEIAELSNRNKAPSWYPDKTDGSGDLHVKLHRNLIDEGVPYHGKDYTGNVDDFFKKADKAYDGIPDKGVLKIPKSKTNIAEDVTPKEALAKIKEMLKEGKTPPSCNG